MGEEAEQIVAIEVEDSGVKPWQLFNGPKRAQGVHLNKTERAAIASSVPLYTEKQNGENMQLKEFLDFHLKRKSSRKSSEREVEHKKELSPIQAWEEGEKSKADNRAQEKKKAIAVWENSKKADLEAKLKKVEEGHEKKKAEYAEKIRNKIAMVHKTADEKRAMVDAKHGEEVLKAEEAAAKFRTGQTPKKSTFSCFGA